MSTVRIQIRRGTAANWTSVDPDLAPGELGLETDTGKMKVGAETATAWTNLPYINVTESGLGDSLDDYILAADRGAANGVASLDSTGNVPFSQLGNIIDGAPGVLNTLNEIAAAVNDDAAFFTTVSNNIATKLPLAGGTMSGAIAMGNSKITGLATPTSNYDASTKKYVDDLQQQTVAGIFTHEGTTTNIHGVADMTALATFGYVDTAVSTHSQDTTNVHGIADTADLATIDYVDSEISTLDTAAQGYATSAGSTAATNLSNHNSDTTNVHGISDTAELATKSYADTAEADAITAAGTAADTKISTAVAALTKSSVGLGNVNNTTDADKPVSTATQTALDLKADLAGPTFTGTVVLPSTTSVGDVSATELGYVNGVTSAIQTQLDDKLSKTGGTMTGALTLSGAPTSDLHAATKIYVDNVAAGINFHEAVHAASTINVSANYSNGTSGVGATLTADTIRAFSTLDGESVVVGQRVLIKNQTDAKQNGIYVLTTNGSGSTPWVLTRATDADNNPTGEMKTGDFVFVQNGTANASVGYINNSTADPIVIGTDNISYTEFNAGKTVVAGSGLTEATPGTISVATGGVTSAMIADGTIVDGDINASAAIAQSKISGLTSDLAAKAPINAPTFTGLVTVAASGVAFTDGTQTRAGVPSVTTFATAISSSATLESGEQDKFVPLTGAVQITLPATGYSTGQSIDFYQASGTGASFASTNSVVGTPGLKFRTTNSVVTAMKTSSGWLVFGDLSA